MKRSMINIDCRFFNGAKPCVWNKKHGCECCNCRWYSRYNEKILIIKLDAIGDVLRSTCIIPKIKERFPSAYITWITKPESIELLSSNSDIDEVWNYNDVGTLSRLKIQEWDYVYNLDNSHPSSAIATIAKAGQKIGFVLSEKGIITPTNDSSLKWLTMASFDRIKKENLESYQEIMYGICGFAPPICKPCLTLPDSLLTWVDNFIDGFLPDRNTPIVGINTGSGSRWPKKMLNVQRIIEVIRALLNEIPKCYILLLGGPNEIDKNSEIAKTVNSKNVFNLGCNHSLLQFSAIIKKCTVILCGDTLALHIASALDIPTVVLFGPTSSAEIYNYDGLIEKIEAEKLDCLCCYSDCNKDHNCMSLIPIDEIIGKIKKQLFFMGKLTNIG